MSKNQEQNNRTITVKDYQARRLTDENQSNDADKSCDIEVSTIMKEMTNTYSFMQMRPITPIEDGLQSCVCIEQDTEETIQAVKALEAEFQKNMSVIKELDKELRQERSENDVENELVETEHVDRLMNTVDGVADGVVDTETESQDQEIEIELGGLERGAKKRKREEDKEEMENQNRKKKLNENAENDVIVEKEPDNMETDEDLRFLKDVQTNKVILNVGGARFETSRLTLRKDPESLLARLFTTESSVVPQGNSIFIDRDPSHFKVILNYLRYDLNFNAAVLPRERKYLIELKQECEYYRVKGLLKIVKRRLKYVTELYGMD